MSDKDVERNVRSSTVEGIRTPTQRHVHGIGEQHAISFGEKSQFKKTKKNLLAKFRARESKARAERRRNESRERGATKPGTDTEDKDID